MNNKPVAWMALNELNGSYSTFTNDQKQRLLPHVSQCYGKWIPLYTHPVKEQDDYCKAYWGNNNKFVDVFLPNSETEVIRFWNNTHPVKELTDEEMYKLAEECGFNVDDGAINDGIETAADFHNELFEFAKAILRKAQEK